MNKYKKIAVAAVSVVMAGTMAASIAGCDKGGNKKGIDVMNRFEGFMQDAWKTAVKGYGSTTTTGGNLASEFTPKVKSGTKELDYAQNTELSTAIGYDEKGNTGIKFNNTLIGNLKTYGIATETTATIYGNTYQNNNLKPAWNALQNKLNVKIVDTFDNAKTGDQMSKIKTSPKQFAGYQLFTASANDINTEGASGNLLNVADYLDYMPNYKAFLDANPIVRLSLTADENGSMYMLPYFDGNDDIEKFVLLRKDFVEKLLDGTTAPDGTVTWKAQGEAKGLTTTSSYAESYMGKTGNYEIDVTDPSVLDGTSKIWGNNSHKIDTDGLSEAEAAEKLAKTVKVKVNYDAALAAAKDEATGLGKAVKDAAGKAYSGDSGNIVDLQNFAINETSGDVNGAKLLTIMREYIKVAYEQGSEKFYVGEGKKLSDVFNSAYAAWDVDLYTALGRCFVTSGTALGGEVKGTKDLFLITGREYKSNRFIDTSALAGELYGVRGLESRYQYTYIKADGNITDARSHTETYEAVNKMYSLTQEGLYNPMIKDNVTTGWSSASDADNKGVQTLSLHDYVQTQTAKAGFNAEQSNGANPYNFAPVITPVSKWDTDDDGTKDTVMRFTESWRGVKNTGWCISKEGVKGNADKLSAALAFVDYFFSNDGQILMTYGPQGNGNDNGSVEAAKAAGGGFWYGNEVTDYPAAALETIGGQKVVKKEYKHLYFSYNDKVYTGEYYNGRQIPILTASSKAMFDIKSLGNKSFTNYARYYIGSALNIGNKDQGFEYQCTAKCGIVGSQIVNIALVNGTIKHPSQVVPSEVGTKNETNWYTLAPSLLPYSKRANDAISIAPYNLVTGVGQANNLFAAEGTATPNLIIDIMAYGLGSGKPIRVMSDGSLIPDTAQGVIDYLNNLK